MSDSDGYPDEEDLDHIKQWEPCTTEGLLSLFRFIQGLWWPDDHYFIIDKRISKDRISKARYRRVVIHTVGWSGNESLMSALQDNWIAWTLTWEQSNRGGHYILHVPIFPEEK